jgi:hypothetical protein
MLQNPYIFPTGFGGSLRLELERVKPGYEHSLEYGLEE